MRHVAFSCRADYACRKAGRLGLLTAFALVVLRVGTAAPEGVAASSSSRMRLPPWPLNCKSAKTRFTTSTHASRMAGRQLIPLLFVRSCVCEGVQRTRRRSVPPWIAHCLILMQKRRTATASLPRVAGHKGGSATRVPRHSALVSALMRSCVNERRVGTRGSRALGAAQNSLGAP